MISVSPSPWGWNFPSLEVFLIVITTALLRRFCAAIFHLARSRSQVLLVAQLAVATSAAVGSECQVKRGKLKFHLAYWKNVSRSENGATATAHLVDSLMLFRSDDAKSLITWMLKMNPRERYTAKHWPQVRKN